MPPLPVIRRGLDPKRAALAQGLSGAGQAVGQGFRDVAALEQGNIEDARRTESRNQSKAESAEDDRQRSVIDVWKIGQDESMTPESMDQFADIHKKRFAEHYALHPEDFDDIDLAITGQKKANEKFNFEKNQKKGRDEFESIEENLVQRDGDGNDFLMPNARSVYLERRDFVLETYGQAAAESMDREMESFQASTGENIFDSFGKEGEDGFIPAIVRARDINAEVESPFENPIQGLDDPADPSSIAPGVNPNAPTDISGLAQGLGQPVAGQSPGGTPIGSPFGAAGSPPQSPPPAGGIPPWYQLLSSPQSDALFVNDKTKKKAVLDRVNSLRESGQSWEEIATRIKERIPELSGPLGVQ